MLSWGWLLEDQNKEPVKFAVYNYPLNNKHYDEIFKVGIVFIIKQPYIKRAKDGYTFIRIDDPNDIEFENKSTADEYKQQGNSCYNFSNFMEAIEFYKKALTLQKNQEKLCILNSNIAISFFQLHLYNDFKEYVDIALKYNKDHTKSIYRKAEYLIYLNKFEQAIKYIDNIKSKFTKVDIDKLYEKLSLRKDCSEGKIDWLKIIQSGRIQEYKSKKIKVGKSKMEGYGVFAVEDIEESQVILVQNFLASINQNRAQNRSNIKNFTLQLQLNSKCLRLTALSLQFSKKLYHLCTRTNQNLSIEEREKNFKKMGSSQISQKIKINAFGRQPAKSIADNFQVKQQLSSIWQFASFFNHSCESNITYQFLQAKMIILTTRKIKKGEQLFIQYQNEGDFIKRQQSLFKNWNFQCRCIYCIQQRQQLENQKTDQQVMKSGKSIEMKKSIMMQTLFHDQKQFTKYMDKANQYFHSNQLLTLMNNFQPKSTVLKNLITTLLKKIYKLTNNQSVQIFQKWMAPLKI